MRKLFTFLVLLVVGWCLNAQVISTFPYNQDFETFTTCGTACGATCVLPAASGWVNETDDDIDWTVDAGGTGSFNTGPTVDHNPGTGTGNYLYTEASGCNGDTAHLVTPYFDFTSLASPTVEFWYHMQGGTQGTMHFDVDTSKNPASPSWVLDIVPSWTDNQNLWQLRSVMAAAYGGMDSVRFRIRGITGSSYESDMAVDDFTVFQPIPVDAEMKAIVSPSGGCAGGTNVPVAIRVGNFGSATLDTIPVAYTLNGGTPVLDTVFFTLAPGVDTLFTFTVGANLSTPGAYTVVSYINGLIGDSNFGNDTVSSTFTIIPLGASTFPYLENFENGPGGWITAPTVPGAANSWEFGNPNNTVISGASSGDSAWVTNLTGSYSVNEDGYVQSPCFDFSSLTLPFIEIDVYWNSEFSWDGANLQSSIDGGQTWQLVGASGDPDNWYNDNSISGAPGGSQEGWTGTGTNGSGGWVTAKHQLNGLQGQPSVLLRMYFGSDASVTDEGFGFDDVFIYQPAPNDVGAAELQSPLVGGCFTASETVTIGVENFGSDTIDFASNNIRVVSVVTGPTNSTDTAVVNTGMLNPGDTIPVTTTTTLDMSLPGTYTFVAYTEFITGGPDSNPLNDTLGPISVINFTRVVTFGYAFC